jgi:Fe-S cluster assembly iron-binding protein IscA
LALDEPRGSEVPVEVNGLGVLIADKVKGYVDGSVVDYIKSGKGEGFAIRGGGSSC